MTINYDPTVDYGYEVNYLIYNYMIYFQNTFNQKLLVLSRSDNVTIFVIIINKMNKLKQRWGIETIFNSQLSLSFCANRVIGMVVKTVLYFTGITKGDLGYWFTPVRFYFPIYQLLCS
jgi:hypothetical protein